VFRASVNGRNGNRGFSLIEMLVASAIFAIVAAVAFILYTAAQKSFKAGENFTDQQQSTRVAFDRMISDIRLAGFNSNPDGDTTRVDEQIEGAWDTAVTIRGDFDFEDPTASTIPESSLPGTVYNVVSTGNDEIVSYVLAKSGPTGSDTLDIWVDPDKPRSKSVKKVMIPNVALVQNNPPYTLYRVTLADITGAFPASPQAATNFIYEPVADNIRTMTFLYYDSGGNLLNPNTPASAADDIGGGALTAVTRGKIRRISVSLVGMTRDPDMNYVDTTDASATQNYRKFDLQSDVIPTNLGRSGIKDLDVTPPAAPTGVSLVTGHCNGILVKWNAPASTDGVSSYVIKYWPQATPSATATVNVPYPHTEYGTIDYLGHGFVALPGAINYCFQVQAKDSAGNSSSFAPSTAPCATPVNASTPASPTNLQATGNGSLSPLDSQISLTWSQVQTNGAPTAVVTGDPNTIGGNTILRDGKGYKLYKDITSSFTPNDATNLVANASVLNPGVTAFTDINVVNCQTYYYKMVTVDTCDPAAGSSSSATGAATGRSSTNIAPAAPTGLTASRTSTSNVTVGWTAVTTKVDGTATYIGTYNIYLAKGSPGLDPATLSGPFTLRGSSATTSFIDTLSGTEKTELNGQTTSYYYYVTAADLCGNESARSIGQEVNCKSNTWTYSPASGTGGGGNQTIRLAWTGNDVIVRVRVHIASKAGSPDIYDQTVTNAGGLTSPVTMPTQWNSSSEGGGTYTLQWEIENSSGCVLTPTTTFNASTSATCNIQATNPTILPVTGKASNLYRTVAWDVQNFSTQDLTILEIDASWTNNLSTHKLQTIAWPSTATTAPGLFTFSGSGQTTPASHIYCSVCTPPDIVFTAAVPVINMSLTFGDAMRNSGGTTETLTVTYRFQDSSGTPGTCQLTIIQGP
jgi:prepilin-type N-terminal cleavage/methylation domain-containing protein